MSIATKSGPKIDPAAAAALELTETAPISQPNGRPLGTRGVDIWTSEDGSIGVGVWEVDAGTFHANFAEYGEAIRIVSGALVCTSYADGTVTTLRPGDTMVFPRGWTGEWTMREPLRKIWTSWSAY